VGLPIRLRPPEDVSNLTLSEAAEAFLRALAESGASPLTVKSYRAAVSSFVSFVGPSTPVTRLTPDDYYRWLSAARARGPRGPRGGRWESTLHYYSIFVRRFLGWLGLRGPLQAEPNRRRGFSGALSWDEVEALLSAARDVYDALIVSLMAESGLRARELVSLTWADVDLVRNQLVHLRLKVGVRVPSSVIELSASRVSGERGLIIIPHITRVSDEKAETKALPERGPESLDPLDVIKAEVGLDELTSKAILDLIVAASEGNEEAIEKALEKLASWPKSLESLRRLAVQ